MGQVCRGPFYLGSEIIFKAMEVMSISSTQPVLLSQIRYPDLPFFVNSTTLSITLPLSPQQA